MRQMAEGTNQRKEEREKKKEKSKNQKSRAIGPLL
jgi:hypothetical protein